MTGNSRGSEKSLLGNMVGMGNHHLGQAGAGSHQQDGKSLRWEDVV